MGSELSVGSIRSVAEERMGRLLASTRHVRSRIERPWWCQVLLTVHADAHLVACGPLSWMGLWLGSLGWQGGVPIDPETEGGGRANACHHRRKVRSLLSGRFKWPC